MRRRQIILAVVTGVLLGVLAALLLLRPKAGGGAVPGPSAAPEAAPEEILVQPAEPDPREEGALPGPDAGPVGTGGELPLSDAVRACFLRLAGERGGGWNLCFLPLPEGEALLWGEEEGPMVSASLIKLPVMAAVYERLEQGTLDRESCESFLGPMITISDNSSANALVRLLGDGDEEAGMAAVNDWCRRNGLESTRMNRLMLQDNGLQNYTSAADCARLLAMIYRGDCVSPAASREMLDLLLLQRVNDRIPAQLPEGTPVAHKTGDLVGLCWADVGIVFSPGGDYILCVISDGTASEFDAKTAAAALSRQIYDLMNQA